MNKYGQTSEEEAQIKAVKMFAFCVLVIAGAAALTCILLELNF